MAKKRKAHTTAKQKAIRAAMERVRYRSKQGYIFEKSEIRGKLQKMTTSQIKKFDVLKKVKAFKDESGYIFTDPAVIQAIKAVKLSKGKYSVYNNVVFSNFLDLIKSSSPGDQGSFISKINKLIKKNGITPVMYGIAKTIEEGKLSYQTVKYITSFADDFQGRAAHLMEASGDNWGDIYLNLIKSLANEIKNNVR